MPDDESSGGGISIPIISLKKLYLLDHTINFLDNWIQYYDDNYQNIISIYKINMKRLLWKVARELTKISDYYKEKTRQQSGQ